MGDSSRNDRPSSDEINQKRTRLTRRFAMFGSPLVILGVLPLLFDLGPERWRLVPFLLGMLINLAAWPIGAWRYPRPLGG